MAEGGEEQVGRRSFPEKKTVLLAGK